MIFKVTVYIHDFVLLQILYDGVACTIKIVLRTPVNIPFIKMEMLTNVLMALVQELFLEIFYWENDKTMLLIAVRVGDPSMFFELQAMPEDDQTPENG